MSEPRPGAGSPLPFDSTLALSRVEGDQELLVELAELFLDAVGILVADVRSAVAAREADQLAFRAHRLKSSLANFFAADAWTAAATLEQIGRSQAWERVQQAMRDLELALERLLPALRHWIRERA